jgi:hypothetical protein
MFPTPLFLVIVQDRLSLGFISLQSLDHCLWSIILTLNQWFTSQIIYAHSFWRVEFNVVDSATGWMNLGSSEAFLNDLKGHIQGNDFVYLITFIQGFCLWKSPWKTFISEK